MPETKDTEHTPEAELPWLNRQERRLQKQLHFNFDRVCAVDAFISFLERAQAQDITRLSVALSQYENNSTGISLAECFAGAESAGEYAEFAESPAAAEPESAGAKPEPAAEDDDDDNDWATKTPLHAETTYDLTMFDADGGEQQSVDLTREEFITLKAHLAKLRGYEVEEVQHA